MPQSHHRIDTRGAPRGHVTGGEGHATENGDDPRKNDGVGRTHFEQQRSQQSSQTYRAEQAHAQTGRRPDFIGINAAAPTNTEDRRGPLSYS